VATLIKTWDFTNDVEGFSLTNVTRLSSGELESRATGRNTKRDGYAIRSGLTYGDIGVPAGSTVNSVVLRVNSRCSGYNVVTYCRWDGYFDGNEAIPTQTYSGITSYGVVSSNIIPLTNATPETTFNITIDSYLQNGNNASALSVILWDFIQLEVDYTPPSYDKSGTVSISANSSVTVNGQKAASGAAEIIGIASAPSVTGEKNGSGTINITGTGTVIIEGKQTIAKTGTVSITADSSVETEGKAARAGTAQIAADASVTASGKSSRTGAVGISEAANIAAAGRKGSSSEVAITVAAAAEAAGRKAAKATVKIEEWGTLDSTGSKSSSGAVAITAGSTITVYGTAALGPIDKTGVVEITAQASIVVTGAKGAVGSTLLSAVGQTVTTGKKNAKAETNIDSLAIPTLTGEKEAAGSVEIASESTIEIIGYRETTLTDPTVGAELIDYQVQIDLDEINPELAVINYEILVTITTHELEISSEDHTIITEVIGVPFIGATVRLNATFPAEAGDLEELSQVKCTITDSDRNIIDTIDGEDIQAGATAGQYFAFYNIPDTGVGDLSYAWSGHLGEELVLLARKAIGRIWQD
jgi:hypothetical protein